ncbi:MAG: hypothetical protein WC670_12745 [Pseudolabrys sp.]|jgi:hypothetical protein
MDTLHTVLRSIRRETKGHTRSRSDHLDVFREFLDHLDRASRRKAAPPPRAAKPKARRGKR